MCAGLWMFRVLFIASFVGVSKLEIDVGYITCQDTFETYDDRDCTNGCSGKCLRNCLKSPENVIGTVFYYKQSPICKSAMHDLRISMWNNSFQQITFQKLKKDKPVTFEPSFRQRIQSQGSPASRISYVFTSPRVSEKVLDVVSLHHHYLNDGNKHEQECRILSDYNSSVYFSNDGFIRRDNSPKILGNNPSYKKYSVTWSYAKTKTGFWCLTNLSSISDIFSIAANKTELLESNRFTVRANRGETASVFQLLNFKRTEDERIEGELTKDGFKVSESHYSRSMPIEIADAGLYKYTKNGETLGLARLIVRACEDRKYGPGCQRDCHECLNGGICHDISGECICPPGFNGTYCQTACPPNYFGKHCNQQCYTKSGEVRDCSEVLFCLPDPYGCSCATGYSLPFCNRTCDNGRYGVNCVQNCPPNCKGPCNPFNGQCVNCTEGWHGDKCEISYPVLKSSVNVTNITSNSVVIHFRQWNKGEDEGEGTPKLYIILYLNTKSNSWSHVSVRHAENENNLHSIKVENLHADTTYLFRIVIQDITGNAQYNGVPNVTAETLCITPSPPLNVTLRNKGPRNICVTWDNPSIKVGECTDFTVFIEIQNANTSEVFNATTTQYRKYHTFNTKPYTRWNVRMRYRDVNGMYSNWSKLESFLSEQDAPSRVRNVEVRNSFIYAAPKQNIILNWEKPEEENGIITKYIIKYFQVGWIHDCNTKFDVGGIFNVKSTTYSAVVDVRLSAVYKIKVSAFTVKEGPEFEIEVRSQQDVPYSIPHKLRIINRDERKISLSWAPPDCSLSNGRVNYYKLMITSNDLWDSTNSTLNVTNNNVTFENLTPYTSYNVSIYASNEVGLSNKSAVVTSSTKSEKPPAPSELRLSQKTMQSFSLMWKPPYPPYGILEMYLIVYICNKSDCEYKEGRGISLSIDEVSCDNDQDYHCYTINNLEAKKKYSISVQAKNINVTNFGDSSNITEETEESVPDPPKQAYLENSTEYSLGLTWDLPTRQNGELKNYRINITASKSFNEAIDETTRFGLVQAPRRRCVIEGLYPATLYNISIEASTSVGYGQPLTVQFSTKHSVPVIEAEPEVLEVTDSTITLSIKPIKFDKGPISEYYVTVERKSRLKKRETKIQDKEFTDYNTSRSLDLDYYSAARLLPEEVNSEGLNITIGDGKTYNGYYNPPLITGENYRLGIAVLSYYNEETLIGYKYLSKVIKAERRASKPTNNGALIGVLFGIIAVLVIVIALIGYRKRDLIGKIRRENGINVKFLNKKNDEEVMISSTNSALEVKLENRINEKRTAKSTEIPIANLEEYVMNSAESGELKRQFMSVKKGQCKSWDISKLPVNKPKNRYGNLLAYDETRVILQMCDNDPYSDYIHANYVDGYRKPRKYIATQGPKQSTINDFWRMICQENVHKIVMATNLVENGKTKCEKYWPETTENYGNVTVSLKDRQAYLDYNIRTFIITEGEKCWMLKHFHYITWPDHGVPRFTNSVVSFLQKIRNYKPDTNSSVVVHCSAGIGRTGTLILLDSMLDMAHSENRIDLVSHLAVMRQQRMNILETYEQYLFVYEALADSLCGSATSILCSDYNKELTKLTQVNPATGKTGFHIQYERLEKIRPKIKRTDCRSAYETDNQAKNRDLDVVPPERARVILQSSASESDYINAVYIDGYKQKDSFIVTQVPLQNTIYDFWKLMFYTETNTFILLNELHEVCPSYWPNPEDTTSYKNIEVSNISEETFESLIIRTFQLNDLTQKESSKTIKQFHLSNWPSSSCIPYSSESILHLSDRVERWQQQGGTSTAVVQCLDGVRACGVYCTCVFVCDKIKTEQEVDVFRAVRCIRENRPQFIENLEQLILCYRIATSYLDSFQIYANFQ